MSLSIDINNKSKNKVDIVELKEVIKKFFRTYKIKKSEISVALVNDQAIKKLNKIYLRKSKTTDVLAFSGSGKELGEIIICYDQIKRQAGLYNNNVKQELIFVLVHGLLHLLGLNDKTEKQRKNMENMAKEFISKN